MTRRHGLRSDALIGSLETVTFAVCQVLARKRETGGLRETDGPIGAYMAKARPANGQNSGACLIKLPG